MSETPELLVADTAGWRAWLSANHATSSGVRLVLAKKGMTEPTRLTYDDALPEALCYGWIDGHLTRWDAVTYCIRFTLRRARSLARQHAVPPTDEAGEWLVTAWPPGWRLIAPVEMSAARRGRRLESSIKRSSNTFRLKADA